MSCCTNTYNLGCIYHCNQLSFGTADFGGTVVGVFTSGNIVISQSITVVEGDPLIFDMSLLNEEMAYTLTLYHDDEQISLTIDGIEYDCFSVKTTLIGDAIPFVPVPGCTEMCEESYDPTGVAGDVFDYNNMHTGVSVDGVTITGTGKTGDPLVAVGGGSSFDCSDLVGCNISNLTNDSGYITSSALSGYVPYTGATGTVDLGTHTLESASINVKGTNGNGHIHLRHQASDASATGQSTTLFADSNGDLKYKNDGGYYTTLKTSSNTANRIYTFPNRDLTIDNITTSSTTNGTGFLKGNGSNISFDNTTYLSSISGLNISLLTNDSGYITSAALSGYATQVYVNSQGFITSAALSPYLTSATAALTYQTILFSGTSIKTINSNSLLGSGNISVEPTITAGTTAQYWRGDKTWQTLDKSAVGLGSVENTALSTWAGSTNITTLGTVATGTWSATAIGATKGGTGQTTYATGDILYASAANTLSKLAAGTNGHVLTLAAGVPTWAAASGSGWGLSGNAGTSSVTNFVGTTDNVGLQFKTNNTTRMYMTAAGLVGIGSGTSGVYPFEISTTSGNSSIETVGRIRSLQGADGYGGFAHYYGGGGSWSTFGTNSSGQTIIINGTSGGGTVPVITFNNGYGSNGNCGIGGSPVTGAKLAVVSTTSVFLPPVMTATNGSSIASVPKGGMCYITDTNGTFTSAGWWGYNGTIWKLICAE